MMIAALYEEMGFAVERAMVLHCDNNSGVMTYASELPEWRSSMLGTKYYRSRSYIDEGDITIVYIPTADNNADIHTKWLSNADHLRHARWLGLFDPGSA